LLKTTLAEVSSIVGKGTVGLSAQGGILKIEANSDAISMSRTLSCETRGSLEFILDNLTLIGLITGRGQIELSMNENHLVVKSVKGRYTAQVGVEKYEPLFMLPDGLKEEKIGVGVRKILSTVLPKVSRDSLFLTQDPPVVRVKADKQQTLVCCLHNFHGSVYRGEGVKNPFTADIPISVANSAFAKFLALETKGSMAVEGSHMYLLGESVKMRLTYIAVGEFPSANIDYLFTDKPLFTIALGGEELETMLSNMETVYQDESALSFNPKGKMLSVESRTETGSIKEEIDAKIEGKPSSFMASLPILREVTSACDKQAIIGLHAVPGKDGPQNMVVRTAFHDGEIATIGVLMGK